MALTDAEELELLQLEEEEYQANKAKQQPETSNLDLGDVAKKFAQGGSMGFLPRIAGGLETAGQAVGIKGLGSPDLTEIELQKPGILEPSKLGEPYEPAKKRYEQALDVASARSPVASNIAELAGGIAMPIPGGAATSMPAKMLKGAALGTVAGYGYSRGDEDKLKNIGSGALIGSLMPPVTEKVIGPIVSQPIQFLKKGSSKLASALTGITEKEIETYAKNADKINALARSSDFSTIEAADKIRTAYDKSIQATKDKINNAISDTLKTSNAEISSQPIIDALEKYKSHLHPKIFNDQPEFAAIDDLIKQVEVLSQDGKMSVIDAHALKQTLQKTADGAYRVQGQIYNKATPSELSAKNAGSVTRKLLNEAAPEIAEANNKLARLHTIEKQMNKNILRTGSPESALMGAGAGTNPRNARALEQLGEITNTPMLQEAENLAAMRTFGNPSLLPVDTTGKSVARMDLGKALLAGAAGGLGGGPTGMAAATALTSPLALKGVINVGRGIGKTAESISKAIPEPVKNIIQKGAENIHIPGKEQVYKTLMQKYLSPEETKVQKQPDQTSIMEKLKGSPYEQLLNNALQNGGQQSFAAANYVLKNRDNNYRKLFDEVQT